MRHFLRTSSGTLPASQVLFEAPSQFSVPARNGEAGGSVLVMPTSQMGKLRRRQGTPSSLQGPSVQLPYYPAARNDLLRDTDDATGSK